MAHRLTRRGSVVRRLVEGELTARKSFDRIHKGYEEEFHRQLYDLKWCIKTLKEADVYPVREKLRHALATVHTLSRSVEMERVR